jgi:hypothetical protein
MAPVFRVMLWSAMILPRKIAPVPIVAEEPTCQNRFTHSPLISEIEEPEATVRVVPIWKWKMASSVPWALSVRVPVNCAEVSNL